MKAVREIIDETIEKLGYEIGCWDEKMERIPKDELDNVLKVLEGNYYDYTDVKVMVDGEYHIVEIATVDNEKDFTLVNIYDYIRQYGGDMEETLDNFNIPYRMNGSIVEIEY